MGARTALFTVPLPALQKKGKRKKKGETGARGEKRERANVGEGGEEEGRERSPVPTHNSQIQGRRLEA